jgi:quinoprotein glucose dehydrogenase
MARLTEDEPGDPFHVEITSVLIPPSPRWKDFQKGGQYPMRKIPLILALALPLVVAPFLRAADLPLVYRDDFSKGAGAWEPTDAKAWKISDIDGNPAYEILGGSKYEPPYRSPINISLLKGHHVGDFVLTARVQSKQEPRGHRDMCVVFGYQDPANFYYVHLGEKTDPHANQIFLVNEAPRIAISEKASAGTPWEVGKWHQVKVVRTAATGLIEIYFDDMETPSHVAHDKTFLNGGIGLGTFDDMGLWDDLELRGVTVEEVATTHPDPKSLTFTKWTPDFPVPDPVAISFDPQGRAYVTQTRRRKANDLDIRDNTDWIPNDLSFTSTADKEAFYREQFTPGNSAKNVKRVADLNGDGLHDIKDLTVLSERIHLIEDTDGDGLADKTGIFAEQLDHLIGGVAGGVLYHEGEVFVSPVPELVKFRDTDSDGKADERTVVASGFGIHLAYAGHDMHGLSVGPDGRIYWSIGDKGIRVKTADGLDYRFPHQGGLMRCEPDGSNFEVFAHGQRNIQEVTFDEHGNFFGVDNDADFAGEKERFVHIEQYSDLGWRSHWQYLRNDYNPWDDEQMYVPFHEGQPRWYTAPLGLYENGPAGFKANPGTGLGPEYDGYFFLTSAPNGQQWAFQIAPRGDSFAMVNDHKIGDGIPLVGLNFAPDGGLYGVDWGGGYPMNENGAIWRIDVPEAKANPLRADTRKWIAADLSGEEVASLVTLLGHADQRVRMKAQFELVKRDALAELTSAAAKVEAPQLARLHAIWGIGQLLRRDAAKDEALTALFGDPDPEVRAQAIKTVTDRYGRLLGLDRIPAPTKEGHALTSTLLPRLEDPSQRVRIQALLGLARLRDTAATAAIVKRLSLKENHHGLTYLRHAGTMALAACAPTETLAGFADHSSDFLRVCASLALGKRGDPAISVYLADKDPVLAADVAVAIHDDWMIPDAMPALAAALGRHLAHEPLTRRALNANFRLGTPEAAERVTAFVAAGEAHEALLEAGLEALENWTTPGQLDLVVGQYRPLDPRDPSVLATALGKHLDALLTSPLSAVRTTAMDLARQTKVPIANETLVIVFKNADATASLRSAALRLLASQKAPDLAAIVDTALDDRMDEVKIAGLDLLAGLAPDKALSEITRRLESKSSLAVKQHAIRSLPVAGGLEKIRTLLTALEAGTIEPALQLDVFETAKAEAFAKDPDMTAIVTAKESAWMTAMATDPVAPYRIALEGGNAARGKSVLLNHPAGQCSACHKIADGKGSDVGPNLKDIGAKKERRYILESLVNPQAVVASGYGNIAITLTDGSSVAGQFRSEKDGKVIVRDPEGKETSVPVDKIKERSPVISTMPPMGFILQKSEIRDVVAYLASLKGK